MHPLCTSLYIVMLCLGLIAGQYMPSAAAEIRIDGDRVLMKSDDGEVLDTKNPPADCKIKKEDSIQIDEGGISIGGVTTKDGMQKNISRSTNLDNVTVITNGKTTIYRKNNTK